MMRFFVFRLHIKWDTHVFWNGVLQEENMQLVALVKSIEIPNQHKTYTDIHIVRCKCALMVCCCCCCCCSHTIHPNKCGTMLTRQMRNAKCVHMRAWASGRAVGRPGVCDVYIYKVHNVRLTTFLLLLLVYYTQNINASGWLCWFEILSVRHEGASTYYNINLCVQQYRAQCIQTHIHINVCATSCTSGSQGEK